MSTLMVSVNKPSICVTKMILEKEWKVMSPCLSIFKNGILGHTISSLSWQLWHKENFKLAQIHCQMVRKKRRINKKTVWIELNKEKKRSSNGHELRECHYWLASHTLSLEDQAYMPRYFQLVPDVVHQQTDYREEIHVEPSEKRYIILQMK